MIHRLFFFMGIFSRIQKTHTPKLGPRSHVMGSRVPPGTDNQPIQGDTALPIRVGCHGQNIPFPIGEFLPDSSDVPPWKFNIHSSPLKIYHPTQKEAGSSSIGIIFSGTMFVKLGGVYLDPDEVEELYQ